MRKIQDYRPRYTRRRRNPIRVAMLAFALWVAVLTIVLTWAMTAIDSANGATTSARTDARVATALVNGYDAHSDKLAAELKATKKELAKERKRGDHWRLKYLEKKKKWSPADVRWVTKRALKYYEIPKDEWAWVLAANETIIFGSGKGTPRESSGNTKAKSGQHLGMHQWNDGWKGTRAQKLDGKWSVYRFVRVYRDGGKAKIRQHWKATVGKYAHR